MGGLTVSWDYSEAYTTNLERSFIREEIFPRSPSLSIQLQYRRMHAYCPFIERLQE
jgi:hypothetical protein